MLVEGVVLVYGMVFVDGLGLFLMFVVGYFVGYSGYYGYASASSLVMWM